MEGEHNPINSLQNTPQVVWATEHLQHKREDENEKQGGGQIIVHKMLVWKVEMKEMGHSLFS